MQNSFYMQGHGLIYRSGQGHSRVTRLTVLMQLARTMTQPHPPSGGTRSSVFVVVLLLLRLLHAPPPSSRRALLPSSSAPSTQPPPATKEASVFVKFTTPLVSMCPQRRLLSSLSYFIHLYLVDYFNFVFLLLISFEYFLLCISVMCFY